MEKRLKRLILAGIGGAVLAKEETEEIWEDLISRGEAALDRSGIRNDLLKYNNHAAKKSAEEKSEKETDDYDAWRDTLKRLTPEELKALKETLSQMESEAETVETRETEAEENLTDTVKAEEKADETINQTDNG